MASKEGNNKKNEPKKLYLSNTDKKLCGVCGGIAEYLDVDSTIVRLVCVLCCFVWGTGLLAYAVCALIMPNKQNKTS